MAGLGTRRLLLGKHPLVIEGGQYHLIYLFKPDFKGGPGQETPHPERYRVIKVMPAPYAFHPEVPGKAVSGRQEAGI